MAAQLLYLQKTRTGGNDKSYIIPLKYIQNSPSGNNLLAQQKSLEMKRSPWTRIAVELAD